MHDAFRAEHQQARRRRALQQAADAPNSTGALPPPLPGTTPPPPAPVAPILDFASLSTVDGTGGSIYVVTSTGVETNATANASAPGAPAPTPACLWQLRGPRRPALPNTALPCPALPLADPTTRIHTRAHTLTHSSRAPHS